MALCLAELLKKLKIRDPGSFEFSELSEDARRMVHSNLCFDSDYLEFLQQGILRSELNENEMLNNLPRCLSLAGVSEKYLGSWLETARSTSSFREKALCIALYLDT
jgi:hypothetical protein